MMSKVVVNGCIMQKFKNSPLVLMTASLQAGRRWGQLLPLLEVVVDQLLSAAHPSPLWHWLLATVVPGGSGMLLCLAVASAASIRQAMFIYNLLATRKDPAYCLLWTNLFLLLEGPRAWTYHFLLLSFGSALSGGGNGCSSALLWLLLVALDSCTSRSTSSQQLHLLWSEGRSVQDN